MKNNMKKKFLAAGLFVFMFMLIGCVRTEKNNFTVNGLSMTIPDDWTDSSPVSMAPDGQSNINVLEMSAGDMDIAAQKDAEKSALVGLGINDIEEKDITIDGEPAFSFAYSFSGNKVYQCIAVKNNVKYVVTYTQFPDGDYLDEVEDMVQSISLAD